MLRHQDSWPALVETARALLASQGGVDVFRCCRAGGSVRLFYAASHHEIGSFGGTMCSYGGMFCDNPFLVLVGAGLAAAWGMFVSIR